MAVQLLHSAAVKRQPSAPGPPLLVLILLALLPVWSTPARGGAWLEFHLSLTGGSDDDVLASPGDSLTLPTLEAAFFQVSPAITGRYSRGAWEAYLTGFHAHNRYSEDDAGAWNRLVGSSGVTLALSREVSAGVTGSAERLRRTTFDDLDANRLSVTPYLIYRPADDVRIELSLGLRRDHYPERSVFRFFRTGADTLQTDRPIEAAVDVGLFRWRRLAISGGAARLSTKSSQVTSEYSGYRLYAAADFRPGLDIEFNAGFSHEYRDYEDREIRRVGDRFRLVELAREDRSREFAASVSRNFGPRVRAGLDASHVDYVSDRTSLSYDQTRMQARVEFRFGPWGSVPAIAVTAVQAGLKLPEFAPVVERSESTTPRSVTFRCRKPGAVRVEVAGSFNEWTPTPLSDADADGTWETTLRLEPGLHRYMFVVNGSDWIRPDGATAYEDDGFGNENGVLHVP